MVTLYTIVKYAVSTFWLGMSEPGPGRHRIVTVLFHGQVIIYCIVPSGYLSFLRFKKGGVVKVHNARYGLQTFSPKADRAPPANDTSRSYSIR